MIDRYFPQIIAAYLLGAVITFGHAAANAACGPMTRATCGPDDHVAVGILSAVFWPLYWSWEVWS